jgi:uncharacterized membrane protein YhaH (DUF805 family)
LLFAGVLKILHLSLQYGILGWIIFFILIVGNYLYVVFIIKRLHDLNLPGKAIWKLIIPSTTITDFFKLNAHIFIKRGTDGPNDYGDEPFI